MLFMLSELKKWKCIGRRALHIYISLKAQTEASCMGFISHMFESGPEI